MFTSRAGALDSDLGTTGLPLHRPLWLSTGCPLASEDRCDFIKLMEELYCQTHFLDANLVLFDKERTGGSSGLVLPGRGKLCQRVDI